MAETSTIFGFMKYVSATDILSDFKKTVDSYFVNSLKTGKILSYFVSIPNSFNCAGSTGLGACAIKSDALAVLGNATTSRMLSEPA